MRVPKQIREYPYIHISQNYLGSNFTMIPRIPRGFRDDDNFIIEDLNTKRVCFTTKGIRAAIIAIDDPKTINCFYIYGAKRLPGLRILNTEKPKCARNNKYGLKFNLIKWLKWYSKKYPNKFLNRERVFIDCDQVREDYKNRTKLINLIKKHFNPQIINCVPDAAKTGEVWATKKVKVKLLGYAHRVSYNKIIISYYV